MQEVYLIKQMWEKQGFSLRKIAELTGYNFRTVQKYVNQEDFSDHEKIKPPREKKLDRFISDIDKWLEDDLKVSRKQRHTAKRIYVRLAEKYTTEFKLSYRTVCTYVTAKKKSLYREDGYLPLTHFPGSSQVDFGTAAYYENGIEKQCKYLILSFPYSNAYYFQTFKGENQECFLTGLQNIFQYLQGVPQQIVFDNLSAAVIMKKKKRIKTDLFMKFEMHYGFEAVFCNPNSGNEKGHVENKVGYHRRNYMVPAPTINDFDDYNQKAFLSAEADMNRNHYRKKETISTLFIEDKASLMPLPPNQFNIFRMFRVRCDKYGKVHFGKKLYSVSPDYAGAELWLFSTHDMIIIKDNDYNNIITHSRIYGCKTESMNWIPYLKLIQKRPRALKYIDFFNTLPANWQELFNDTDKEKQKEYLKVLSEILVDSSMDVAKRVLDETRKFGVHDAESIKTTYTRLSNGNNAFKPLTGDIPQLPEFTVEWSPYGDLITRRLES